MTSAYPASVEVLIPQARRLAAELGELPSRNRLMTQYRIGAKKAGQILTALTETTPTTPSDPAPSDPVSASASEQPEAGRRLHAVPDQTQPESTESTESTGPDPTDQPPSAPANGAVDGAVEQGGASARAASVADPVDRPTGLEVRWLAWTRRLPASWPLLLLALPAFVAIWSGWVGLGELTGFGLVHPLPGIADGFTLNTAITLPVGVETYAAYALKVALASGSAPRRARRFAGWSAAASLVIGAAGQVAYHLMSVHHMVSAPWQITTVVSCLPVVVLGCGAALAHLQHRTHREEVS
jgi:hypothetical protein